MVTEPDPDLRQPIREIGLIAGRGVYPLEWAAAARAGGVERIFCVAFKGETQRAVQTLVDEVHWLHVGKLQTFLDAFRRSGVSHAVMTGQITPRRLYHMRMDKPMFELLRRTHPRNAETLFGAVADELDRIGIRLLPAHLFMESAMPAPGLLGTTPPSPEQEQDIRLGIRVARATSGLDIGQTVVIKQGTVLAVEAFEGTDRAILRAGRLGGSGSVVVKTAKRSHDMRFDIPVIGRRTFSILRRAGAAVLAVEAHRTILLERARLRTEADRQNLVFCAFAPTDTGAPTNEERTGT